MRSAPNPSADRRRVAAASVCTSGFLPYLTFRTSPPSNTQSNFGVAPLGSDGWKRQTAGSGNGPGLWPRSAADGATAGALHTPARASASLRTSSARSFGVSSDWSTGRATRPSGMRVGRSAGHAAIAFRTQAPAVTSARPYLICPLVGRPARRPLRAPGPAASVRGRRPLAHRDGAVQPEVHDGARRQLDLPALVRHHRAAAADQHPDERALPALQHPAEDAADGGADARALLVEALLLDAGDARPDVDAPSVGQQELVERQLDATAVRRAPGRLDVVHDAAHASARGNGRTAVDADGIDHRAVDAVLATRRTRRQGRLQTDRDLGPVRDAHAAGVGGPAPVERV